MLKLKFLLLSCFIFHAYNSYGVTRDGDSLVVIAPSKELELPLDELFSFTTHKDTPQRRLVIQNWITGGNPSVEIINGRFNFLIENWNNKHFRIFDLPKEASEHLEINKYSVLLRLSSTKPGEITVTFKRGQEILHTRYKTSGLHIVVKGQLLLTMEQFITKISQPNSAAEYIVSN